MEVVTIKIEKGMVTEVTKTTTNVKVVVIDYDAGDCDNKYEVQEY